MPAPRYRLRLDRLKTVLERSRLSQNHWALKLGLSRGHWSDLIHGRHPYPSAKTRERLVEVLGLPFEELFEEETGPPDTESAFKAALRDRYLIDTEVGRGGMGVVYLARDLRHGRQVAVKMVSPEAVGGIGPEQFLKEIRYTAQLQHHHILPLFDSGLAAECPFYVMPYVKGGSLKDHLKRRGRLSVDETLRLLKGMGAGLSAAHGAQVLHCDIKPANVLLSDDHPFVADFGIARAIHREFFEWGQRKDIDSSAGTPAYVSPEQATGESNLDARSDVYSLACVAFEMLTGQPPFTGGTTRAIVARRFMADVPEAADLNPGVPRAVSNVIRDAMAVHPRQRPASVAEFLAALDEARAAARSAAAGTARLVRGLARVARRAAHALGATAPGGFLETVAADLRFSVRTLRRRPGLSLIAIFTLALGIGASTAMFSVVNNVLLKPLEYPDPDRVVSIYPTSRVLWGDPAMVVLVERATFSWAEFFAVRERQQSFEAVAAYLARSVVVAGRGPPEAVTMGLANHELFTLAGVVPVAGRLFTDADDLRSGLRTVLLTEGYWRERFGAAPDAVGSTLDIEGVPFTVAGVLPAAFRVGTESARLWGAQGPTDVGWGNHNIRATLGRLKPGVGPEQARAEVEAILQSLEQTPSHPRHGASIFSRQSEETRHVRRPLLILIGASFLLLFVACGNVAAVLLSLGIGREQELAVRTALGAPRRRVVRQLLTDSVVLALAGAAAGAVVAFVGLDWLLALAPGDIPRLDQATVDLPVLGFAIALGLAVGLGFGLVPAAGLSGDRPGQLLASSRGTTSSRIRLHRAVVVGELALATALMVSAALLARSLAALNRVELGFDAERLVYARVAIPQEPYTGASEDVLFQRLVDAVGGSPAVEAVAVTSNAPLTGDQANNPITPEGWQPGDEQLYAERRHVSVNFFGVTRTPILDGRPFDAPDDHPGALSVIISEGLARRMWPGQSAVGRRVRWYAGTGTVVGVAGNVRDENLESETELAFYVPFRQLGVQSGRLLIRTRGDPANALGEIRARLVAAAPPDIPIAALQPMTDLMADTAVQERFRTRLMVTFAGLAGLFALLGIYGVTARAVAQRTPELAIRMALGAERRAVLAMVLRQGALLALGGLALGLGLALVAGRALRELLYGVTATDPIAIGGIALLVAGASVAAGLFPARRATRVDPMEAMRAE